MNKKIVIKIFLGLFLISLPLNAQLSTREVPIGFEYDFSKELMPIVVMPPIDLAELQKEDEKEESLGVPPRFGYMHSVNLNLTDVGIWHTLENGDKLCQLIITCPKALSINLLYDKFWIPDGAKFFIYSQNKKHHIGAFTEFNNKGTKDNVEGFATGLIYGDTTILEYYLPKDCKDDGIISIVGIVHGYRYMDLLEYGYGNVPGNWNLSGSCQVNINCPEGANWQNEKRAVALIIVGGNRMCTGSLINNTGNDNYPFFLTANHCLSGYSAEASLNHWTFYWNYEAPNCSDPPTEPLAFSTNGAKVLANKDSYSGSDFALLKLDEDPVYLTTYTPSFIPYYLGWDRTGNSGTGGVCIHHPRCDIKKISTYNASPVNSICANSNFWDIWFIATTTNHSVVQNGSSGSALINSNRRIIGQLCGPYNAMLCPPYQCENPAGQRVAYGKFSVSWTGGGTNTTRLSNHLDPNSTGLTVLDGISYNCVTTTVTGTHPTPPKTIERIWCKTIEVQNATVPTGKTLELKAPGKVIIDSFKVEAGAKFIVW
jgi:hypothetical protein